MNDDDKKLFEHIARLEDSFKQIIAETYTPSDLFYATGLSQVESHQLFNLLNLIANNGEQHEEL
jgi:hypothetical protein